jgi:hypothetical protein
MSFHEALSLNLPRRAALVAMCMKEVEKEAMGMTEYRPDEC